MIVIKQLGLVSIFTALIFMGCTDGEESWVSIDPIQCLGNPWEADWAALHEGDSYPLLDDQRLLIFKNYYLTIDLEIIKSEIGSIFGEDGGATCESCSCPTGQRYFALVAATDEDEFIELGFVERRGPP